MVIASMPDSRAWHAAASTVAQITFAGSADTTVPAAWSCTNPPDRVRVPGPDCAVPAPFGNTSGLVAATAAQDTGSVRAPSYTNADAPANPVTSSTCRVVAVAVAAWVRLVCGHPFTYEVSTRYPLRPYHQSMYPGATRIFCPPSGIVADAESVNWLISGCAGSYRPAGTSVQVRGHVRFTAVATARTCVTGHRRITRIPLQVSFSTPTRGLPGPVSSSLSTVARSTCRQ